MAAMLAVGVAIVLSMIAVAGCASGPAEVRPPPDLPQPSELHQCVRLPSKQAAAFRNNPGYEQFEVSVLDPAGAPPTYLTAGDFLLTGQALFLSAEFAEYVASASASTAILVDNSSSAEGRIDQERDFVRALVGTLQPRDDVALLAYSRRAYLLQPMTSDRGAPLRMLALMKPSGAAALYDAAADGLKVTSASACYARRSLVIISSGFDDASHISADELIQRAREQGVAIYFVGIGFSADVSASEREQISFKSVARIVSASGGQIFLVDQREDTGAVRSIAKEISANMRGQYVVGFVLPASDKDPVVQIEGHREYLVVGKPVAYGAPPSAATTLPGPSIIPENGPELR